MKESDVEEMADAIEETLVRGGWQVRVTGGTVTPHWTDFNIQVQCNNVVTLDEMLESVDVPRYTAVLGVSELGEPLYANLRSDECRHIIITGEECRNMALVIKKSLMKTGTPMENIAHFEDSCGCNIGGNPQHVILSIRDPSPSLVELFPCHIRSIGNSQFIVTTSNTRCTFTIPVRE